MEKKTIKLTENDLRALIREAVETAIQDMQEPIQEADELEEGWFGDKWNQAKAAGNTLMQKGDVSLKDRFQKAGKNWASQGELNNINNLASQLSAFVEAGQLDPNMTIAQLIGGKINNNKFGRMSAMSANRRSQIAKRGGSAY